MANDGGDSFLGTGWGFPPEFSASGARMVSGEKDILESLQILFRTAPGERFLRPDYGLRLDDLLFEPLSTTAVSFLKDRIRTGLLIHEPRIETHSIDVDSSRAADGALVVSLEFSVLATNNRYNLVFPFYLRDSNEQRSLVV